MRPLEQHEISEVGSRIINPFTDDKLMLLGRICQLEAGQRQLDLASGKGEMLCRWASEFGIGGVGVDVSEVFDVAARERADEFGVSDRVRFVCADASIYRDGETYDVVSCIGATWIGDGLLGTIALMRGSLRPGGLLLVGEPYWKDLPPDEAYGAMGVHSEDFTSLAGTLARFRAGGCELVEMVLADDDSWDRYAASQWWAVERWLKANATDDRAQEMRAFLTHERHSYLNYGRRYLGWGVFVLRVE